MNGSVARRLCSLGFAALASLTALAAGGASPAQAVTKAVPACATGSLVVWLDTQGDATAGSTFFQLELTNFSGRRCTLRGYPGISGIGLDGRQLGSPAARNAATPVRTLTLAPGESVRAVLQIADVGVFPRATCSPVRAAGLRVYPPNQTRSKVVPFPFRACARAGPVYLHVQAVARQS